MGYWYTHDSVNMVLSEYPISSRRMGAALCSVRAARTTDYEDDWREKINISLNYYYDYDHGKFAGSFSEFIKLPYNDYERIKVEVELRSVDSEDNKLYDSASKILTVKEAKDSYSSFVKAEVEAVRSDGVIRNGDTVANVKVLRYTSTPPQKITNLKITNERIHIGDDISLEWSKDSRSEKYYIEREVKDINGKITKSTLNTTSNLLIEKAGDNWNEVRYRVRGHNEDGYGTYSDWSQYIKVHHNYVPILKDRTEESNILRQKFPIHINGTVEDPDEGDVITVKYKVNGKHIGIVSEGTINNGRFNYSKNLVFDDGYLTDNGTKVSDLLEDDKKYTLEIWAVDKTNESTEIKKVYFYTIENTPPKISGEDQDLGVINRPIIKKYQVSDDDNDPFIIEEWLNDKRIAMYKDTEQNKEMVLKLSQRDLNSLKRGSKNVLKLVAIDQYGSFSERKFTFIKGNSAPKISGYDMNIGQKNEPFTFEYIVEDNDIHDIYTVSEYVNNELINEIKNQKGRNVYYLNISEEIFNNLENEKGHSITIVVNDGEAITKRNLTFKKVSEIKYNLEKIIQLQDRMGNKLYPIIKTLPPDVVKSIRKNSNSEFKVYVSHIEPDGEEGSIYYNTEEELYYAYQNGEWAMITTLLADKKPQEAPEDPPELESKTDTTILLKEIDGDIEIQYRYQGGPWLETPYFSGLSPNTEYKFEIRKAGNSMFKPSEPSPVLSVTTDKSIQSPPKPPIIQNLGHDRVTIIGEANTEVKISSNDNWYPSPYTFTGLKEETEYVAYARKIETNTHKASPASLETIFTTPRSNIIYGVEIDESNANPETRVKYIDDAFGFKPVRGNNGNTDWGSWKDTFVYEKFKPCVVKNGEVQYYLNKEDRTKKADGSPSNLTGADGDVMVEIDKMWVKLNKVGDKQYIRVSDGKQEGYQCLAHTNGDEEVDKIYVGAYLGYEQSGKLRSISGVEPTGDKTIGAFRDIAEANGDRYHQVPFYPLTLLQSIMTIVLKSTDTQAALGRGHVDDSGSYSKTGNTNRKGMMFGETRGQANSGQICFMGIEDFWGNKRWWIDGCMYDGGSIKTATTNFNDTATGYRAVGNYSTGGGYIKSVKGDNNTGFIPDKRDGSISTHYCDYGSVYGGYCPNFGGHRSYESRAGGFFLPSDADYDAHSELGSRLFIYGKSIK